MKEKAVLYVEDDENDAFFLTLAFQKAGVTAPLFVVSDGEEAVAFLEGKGKFANREQYPMPSMLLLDLNLPKKPGLAVLRWVRQQPECYTLPVIILSASNYEFDVHRAYAFGANAYLVKPSERGQAIEMVRSLAEFWLTRNQAPVSCVKFDKVSTRETETGPLHHLACLAC